MNQRNDVYISYDPKFDVLYYNFSNAGNAYGDDGDYGIVTFHDFDTDEITGYTIIGFGKSVKDHGAAYNSIKQLFDANRIYKQYCLEQ